MDREAEFYLYTLHDPTLSSKGSISPNVSFATLCPLVDRHTRWQLSCLGCTQVLVARFKIFLSTMFYIGHGWGQRNSVHLTGAYKGGKVGGNPKKVGTPSSNASNNTQKVDKIEAVKRRGGIIEVHKFAQGVSKDQARYFLAHCCAIFLCYLDFIWLGN